MQAHRLVAELAHQEHRLPRGLIERQSQLVLRPGLFHGPAHLALGPKEAVGRHGIAYALVRAEVVVVVDEVRQPLLGIQQLQGLNTGPEFFAHRAPEALAFAQCLGVVGLGDHVLYALLGQELLKLAPAPPGIVLPPLVRQQFHRLAEALNALQ